MRKVKVKGIRKSIVLSIAIMFFAVGSSALADANWDNFTGQASGGSGGNTIMNLGGNATANTALSLPPVPSGANNYVINGNGHTITADNTTNTTQSVITSQASSVDNPVAPTVTIGNINFEGSDVGITGNGAAITNSGTMTVSGTTTGGVNVSQGTINTGNFSTTFKNNSVKGNGGAIANQGSMTIENVLFGGAEGDGNSSAQSGGTNGFGGAIDNNIQNGGTLTIRNSGFSYNTSDSFGGAIANRSGNMNINGSVFNNNTATTQGGAIVNAANLTINNSSFNSNSGGNYGGAITNSLTIDGKVQDTSSSLTITNTDFRNNTAQNGGGAIFNGGTTTSDVKHTLIVNGGTFENNTATLGGQGGAIYNSVPTAAGGSLSVANISNAKFVANAASSGGGAITNAGKMTISNSVFEANGSHNGVNTQQGGAIRNFQSGTVGVENTNLTVSNSTFKNNVASNYGGAVYNSSTTSNKAIATITDSTFIGNTTTAGTAASGGAIYGGNDSITNITASSGGKTTVGETLYGTRPEGYNSSTDTISFVGNAVGNFNASEGGVIELNTIVRGDAGNADSAININNGNYTGLVHVKGDGGTIQNANIHLYNGELKFDHDKSLDSTNNLYLHGGLLNLLNNEYASNQIHAQSLHLMGDSHIKLDVDLGGTYSQSGNPEMDALLKANIGTVTNDGGHTLFIDQMKSVSEAKEDSVRVLFTDADALIGHVQLSKGANIVEAPIHKYEVKQETVPVPPVGGGGATSGVDPGEYFVFNKIGDSDSVITAPVAAQAAFLIQDNLYRQSFANMDMVTLMTPEQRMAWKMRNRYASAYHTGVFAPNIIPEERDGFYVRPFANFESVPLQNGPKVSNVSYGTLIGGESDLIDLGHGWDGNFSFFGAYHGSHQAYNGVDIWQNGGTVGGVATAYKGNFWTGVTANIGASAAQSSHIFGNDDFPILMTGAAWKSGYNWGLLNNKMVIQPSYMMSYTFVNVFDYTNAAGVKITQDPLHAIEIIPGLRIIGNLKNGWQPYLGVNMTWNIMDKTKFYANDVALTELSIKPYIEYGLGIQKRYGDRFTGFGQAMIRNGGRNGVAFTLGMRWALGH